MTFFSQAITHVRCPPAGSYFGVASALARYVGIMKIHTHQRKKKNSINWVWTTPYGVFRRKYSVYSVCSGYSILGVGLKIFPVRSESISH